VKEAGGEVMCFKVKPTTKMEKIFQAYCQRRGVDLKSVRFLLDGQRVQPDVTPKMLELENNAEIDVMMEAVGC